MLDSMILLAIVMGYALHFHLVVAQPSTEEV
jgi:hypothetical protein